MSKKIKGVKTPSRRKFFKATAASSIKNKRKSIIKANTKAKNKKMQQQ